MASNLCSAAHQAICDAVRRSRAAWCPSFAGLFLVRPGIHVLCRRRRRLVEPADRHMSKFAAVRKLVQTTIALQYHRQLQAWSIYTAHVVRLWLPACCLVVSTKLHAAPRHMHTRAHLSSTVCTAAASRSTARRRRRRSRRCSSGLCSPALCSADAVPPVAWRKKQSMRLGWKRCEDLGNRSAFPREGDADGIAHLCQDILLDVCGIDGRDSQVVQHALPCMLRHAASGHEPLASLPIHVCLLEHVVRHASTETKSGQLDRRRPSP